MPFIDITGNTYNRFTVLREVLPRNKPPKWVCECVCGVIKEVVGSSLKNGSTKSCGCLHTETNKKLFTKHGDYLEKLYQVHRAMLQRCSNPKQKNFHHYGGRGISVCEGWVDYSAFKQWALSNGYQAGLSIERLDTDKDYCPTNCTWADETQQARNRRAMPGKTSKYIGVSWDSGRKKWFVTVGIGRKSKALGRFTSEIEAAQARDAFIVVNNLPNFVLNFN